MDNNFKNFFKKNSIFVAISSVVAIVLVFSIYFSYNSVGQDEDKIAKTEEIDSSSVNKSNVKSYTEQITEQLTTRVTEQITDLQNSKTEVTEQSTEATSTESKEISKDKATETTTSTKTTDKSNNEDIVFSLFDDTKEMTWPVSGKIIMDYSTETAIFDKTLEQYRTNNSICISNPQGTDVVASAEGVVEKVFTDNESGKTIVINHGNGWLSTYSQLAEDILVEVGTVVNEGQKIAKIGSPSSYSTALGPHLEFMIIKDDVASDPKLVLAQIQE